MKLFLTFKKKNIIIAKDHHRKEEKEKIEEINKINR